MKLTLSLHHGTKISEHQVEVGITREGSRSCASLSYALDGACGEGDFTPIGQGGYSILLGGRSYEVRVMPEALKQDGQPGRQIVTVGARSFTIEIHDPRRRRVSAAQGDKSGPQEICAPMPGKIVKILAAKDSEVAAGADLLVIEAMKMQNVLRAPRAGKVAEIYVTEGAGVETGTKLARLV